MNNMEIQVGEYVRCENGTICKMINWEEDINEYVLICREYRDGMYFTSVIEKEDIVNHNFNLIKLIGAGDYVNGKLVYSVGTAIGDLPIVNHTDGTFTPQNMIKSIVTKEQFKSMEYILGGKDE